MFEKNNFLALGSTPTPQWGMGVAKISLFHKAFIYFKQDLAAQEFCFKRFQLRILTENPLFY